MEKWDHTAMLAWNVHQLTQVVLSALSKKRQKANDYTHFHPYRRQSAKGSKGVKVSTKAELKKIFPG